MSEQAAIFPQQTVTKRSFWLSRTAALLIIFCFFIPWYTDSCSGEMNGFELSTFHDSDYVRDLNGLEIFFRGYLFPYLLFIPPGALLCLLMSFVPQHLILAITF